MTKIELRCVLIERKRLSEAYSSLITSRNIIVDMLDKEYLRHVKLTKKKEDSRGALLLSLSKSRNIKRFQKDLSDVKKLIKENQAHAKKLKSNYKESKLVYDSLLYQMN